MIGSHINESTVNGKVLHSAVTEVDTCVVLDKCAQECNVSWQKSDFSTIERASDDLTGITCKQHTLR